MHADSVAWTGRSGTVPVLSDRGLSSQGGVGGIGVEITPLKPEMSVGYMHLSREL